MKSGIKSSSYSPINLHATTHNKAVVRLLQHKKVPIYRQNTATHSSNDWNAPQYISWLVYSLAKHWIEDKGGSGRGGRGDQSSKLRKACCMFSWSSSNWRLISCSPNFMGSWNDNNQLESVCTGVIHFYSSM